MKTSQRHCEQCGCLRLAVAPAPNHAFWLLLTLVTAGIGAIFWLIAALPAPRQWRCSTCGSLATSPPPITPK